MNSNKKRLVFATNNPHKLEEARQIIPDGIEIASLADIGCHDDISETADTLEGNALIKARWIHDKYGCDCFADDTGLMVDSLGGAPGVYSARYAGEHCTPADNVAKLLSEMEGEGNREAHFSTVVALISDGETHCFEGRVDGTIATEPHGNGGFGYDPIFVVNESGKCFAEMTADEKNAISHRGRAMRKLRDFFALFLTVIFTTLCSSTANATNSQWRALPSYDGHMERIVDTPDFTYFLGAAQEYAPQMYNTATLYGTLFRYDKDSDELLAINSNNYLSANVVSAIEYNFKKKFLAVGYHDGNIDILYDNGKVENISGIKLADSSLKKEINHISFDESGNEMIVATNFGYVIVDCTKNQIKTSCVFNSPVHVAGFFDDQIWIVRDDRQLYYAPNGIAFVQDFKQLDNCYGYAHRMLPTADGLILLAGAHNNLSTLRIAKYPWGYAMLWIKGSTTISAEKTADGVMFTYRDGIVLEKEDGTQTNVPFPPTIALEKDELNIGGYDGHNFWVSTGRSGISQWKLSNADQASWTMLKDKHLPNAASAFMSSAMAYHPDYGMLVRNHGYDYTFNDSGGNYYQSDDLLCAYRNMEWKYLSTPYNDVSSKGLIYYDPDGVAIDPNNRNHVYCGSTFSGLLRLDLQNPENSIHMSHANDPAGGYGHPGFAAVTEPVQSSWMRSSFAGPQFDSKGNMWTIYVDNSDAGRYGSNHLEMWCWTPAARAATTNEKNVQPFIKIDIPDVQMHSSPIFKVLNYGSHKNMLMICPNENDTDKTMFIIYDHNGTPGDTSDDRMSRIMFVNDQDGNSYSFFHIPSIYEDMQTGLIWFSTPTELFTLDLKDITSDTAMARRVKVPRNDGTNLADYLLDNVKISHITSDSRGRKWFATLGSGLVCTSADGREVLYTFTPENSGIPSSDVYYVCENPDNNSLMISTRYGLCAYYMSSQANTESSSVRAYPNPVEPSYYGYVTIDGLASDAMVKIVDAHANLVKECGMANNGVIEWNLTDNNYKRVPGGVYFIIATNGPNSDKYSKMGKVLVIE